MAHPYLLKNGFLLFCLISIMSAVHAQTVTVKLWDAETKEAVEAKLIVHYNEKIPFENLNISVGIPTLHEMKVHPDTITHIAIYHISYQEKMLPIPNNNENTVLDVYLKPADYALNEVVVMAYESNKNILLSSGSIAHISKKQLQRSNDISLVQSMNNIPGIRMEQRTPGSYRLSIRGSSLRAPFGIRNVKVYWNDIPFTEANGNTQLNLIDLSTINKVDIIKGPAGSMYGAGNGGAVILKSEKASYGKSSIGFKTLGGSYGLWRAQADANWGGEKGGVKLQYAHQQSDGYRDHTTLNRHVIHGESRWQVGGKNTKHFNAFAYYADLKYDLPGGLNEEQYATDPTLSRPGSIEQNASIDLNSFYGGLSMNQRLNAKWESSLAAYGHWGQLESPFNTNYKIENQKAFGFRGKASYETAISENFDLKATFGTEFQKSWVNATNFGNVAGVKDTLNFDDDINPTQFIVFGQGVFTFSKKIILTTGASFNYLNYAISRLDHLDNFSENDIAFTPVVSPRLALLYALNEHFSIHSSISLGFSPPTVNEIRTSEGSINTDLQAEKGTNYEGGFKGFLVNKKLHFDVTVFNLQLKDAIVTSIAESGTVLFDNAGSTSNTGLETALQYYFFKNEDRTISLLKTYMSYTYNHFRFKNYIDGTDDFSGNQLTGVAPHIFVAGMDFDTKAGVYTNLTYNYTHSIPLNDANTVYSSHYHLLQLKVGWKNTIFKNLNVDIFGGIDNLLNEKYSLGNDLNAFGGRYFQPSPARNFYVGVGVKY